MLELPFKVAAREGVKRKIERETIERLSYGRGVPLRVLLTLYRWARAYAGVPGGVGYWSRFAATRSMKFSIDELAKKSLGGTETKDHDAVQRATSLLKDLHLVAAVERRGKPTIFVPHAIGQPVSVPQFLWSSGYFLKTQDYAGGTPIAQGQPVLSGPALLILVHVLVLACGMPTALMPGFSSLAQPAKNLIERGQLIVPEARLARTIPSSAARREALKILENQSMVVTLVTRGERFVLCPGLPAR